MFDLLGPPDHCRSLRSWHHAPGSESTPQAAVRPIPSPSQAADFQTKDLADPLSHLQPLCCWNPSMLKPLVFRTDPYWSCSAFRSHQLIGLREKQEHPMIFMGKSMVSCRFSLKSTHWSQVFRRFPGLFFQDTRHGNDPLGGVAGMSFNLTWKIRRKNQTKKKETWGFGYIIDDIWYMIYYRWYIIDDIL